MSGLRLVLDDVGHGLVDSLSGWWVAVKCWRDEARLLTNRPPPPKAFSEHARKRTEQQKKKEPDGNLMDIIWTTVTTAGVALLITFLIQTGCSYIASLFGERFQHGLMVSAVVLDFLWWFPSMAVIKLTSIISNNEVADKVFLFKYGRPKFMSIGATISEFIFSSIYQTVFILQAGIVCLLVPWPYVAVFMEWLHYSLFYAVYAFEYKWALLGIPGHTRVAQIENNWPYYFAFGLPVHLATGYWDSLYTRTVAFTLLFPFSILGATAANPPRPQFVFPIHVMFPSVYITNEAYKLLRLLAGKSKVSAQMSVITRLGGHNEGVTLGAWSLAQYSSSSSSFTGWNSGVKCWLINVSFILLCFLCVTLINLRLAKGVSRKQDNLIVIIIGFIFIIIIVAIIISSL